jgi:hypothetical protein
MELVGPLEKVAIGRLAAVSQLSSVPELDVMKTGQVRPRARVDDWNEATVREANCSREALRIEAFSRSRRPMLAISCESVTLAVGRYLLMSDPTSVHTANNDRRHPLGLDLLAGSLDLVLVDRIDFAAVDLEASLDEEVRTLHELAQRPGKAAERRAEVREDAAESDDGDLVQSRGVPLNQSVDEVGRSWEGREKVQVSFRVRSGG